jgi:hypothetical protein
VLAEGFQVPLQKARINESGTKQLIIELMMSAVWSFFSGGENELVVF